ncbi:bowman-birk serine protease inhibitor family protein, putative (macronuclear) [Tetrahymena thermophila SB210]|uniref:Bowman-birk serine protease inhibitor family protein, putative n=1 Tax=Tetrahymena thermophila (strain SB210) TaxID=312017 RepID=Q23EW2_TETTS|nr:bowman-birk serine protease inhibitor family protein, putative [Tetrahymena thermophila SB210]EAR95143.2 bowman-birk serine protease inhibitor family protein, putative [Tetrahymena thermophila SB210]|eukprot:XP_001015388.2 bowman-birk serine protease inhibitor family protein, putative [Tetrahymena thermophila SB210]
MGVKSQIQQKQGRRLFILAVQLFLILQYTEKTGASYLPLKYFQTESIDIAEHQPCLQLPDNQSTTILFQQLFPSKQQVQRIAITFITAFFGYSAYSYTLFSIHQSNIAISLDYNLQSKKIFLKVNEKSQETDYSALAIENWFFINLDIQLVDSKIEVLFQIHLSSSGNTQIPLTYPFLGQFIQSELEINYGNPPIRLGVNPSCQLISHLMIGVAYQTTPPSYNDIFYQLFQVKTNLILSYDFFYTQSNPGELISDIGDQFLKIKLQNQQLNNTISINSNFILTNQHETNNQITFSFYIKFNTLPTTISTYLQIFFDKHSYDLQFGNNQIKFGTQTINQNIQIWNHILIIQQYYLYLFVNGIEQISFVNNIPVFTFKYFFYSNDSSFQLNHIRIYTGSLLSQGANCFLKSSDGSCVLCMDDYLLDFQNKMKCVPKSAINTDNEIPGVKDWNPPRKVCPKNMINDNSSITGCKCLIGYYFDGNNCVKCPKYCRYCNSLQDCNQQRDENGNCQNKDAFDNGQSCLIPLFTIPHRQNIRKFESLPDFGQTCAQMDTNLQNFIFAKDQLKFNLGDSIFFSFYLVAKTINNIFNEINIANIQDGNNQIIKITLSCQIVNSYYILFLKFYVKDQLKKQYIFDQNDFAWIAFWTDNNNFVFMMSTNQYNYYDQLEGTFLFILSSNIQICVGRCDTNLINGCLSLTNFPITIVKNIPYPTQQGINQFFSILLNDYQLIGRYKLDINQSNPFSSISDSSGQPSQSQLQFSNPVQIFNQFQGFQLDQNIVASITYPANQYGDLFNLSFNIEFDSSFQYQSFQLLKITNQNTFLSLFLVPDYDQQIMVVQIYYINVSKTFKNAVLLLNQSNFFLIAARVETKKQVIVTFYIDIVCNYIKETFEVVVNPGNSIYQIDFGDNTTQYKVFIDNINIYQQNVFLYYDYTNIDPCFVYVNLAYMNCLYLKRGYLYYNNQIITFEQCSNMSQLNQASYMNLKDQTCNIKVPQNFSEYLCALMSYENNKFVCSLCKDGNADPNLNCLVCKKSYFFDSLTNKCQQCDAQCLACKDKSSNCVDCKYINQITPSCDCISVKQTQQNTCQCNYKCGSCSGIDNNICKTCSSDRRVMPNCDCNQIYEEKSKECVEIQNQINCDQKCQYCINTTDNCTICSKNRINPPSCYCEYGYEELSDGSCSPCQKGFLYDSISRKCKACSYNSQLGSGLNTQQQCLKSLNITYNNSFQEKKKYYLRFTFDKNLQIFNLSGTELNKIASFYIPEIKNSSYSIINPQFIQNQFQVEINVKANFQADYIFATFLTNKYFLSQDQEFILNEKYLNTQMKIKIGPFIFKQEILENQATLDDVSRTFVFPQVPDYLSEIDNIQFSLFSYQLQGKDAQQPNFAFLIQVTNDSLEVKNFFNSKIEQRLRNNFSYNLHLYLYLVLRNKWRILHLSNGILCINNTCTNLSLNVQIQYTKFKEQQSDLKGVFQYVH